MPASAICSPSPQLLVVTAFTYLLVCFQTTSGVQWVTSKDPTRTHAALLSRQTRVVAGDHNFMMSSVRPGRIWFDTDKHRIRAHAGAMLVAGTTTYWYGANKSSASGRMNTVINVYSSQDLYQWRNHGAAFMIDCSKSAHVFNGKCSVDQPKVLFDESKGEYLMWMRSNSSVVLAKSSSPLGPFELVKRWLPNGEHIGGMTAFLDPVSKRGFLVYNARPHNFLRISEMNEDLSNVTGVCATIQAARKAPAVFYSAGHLGARYYVWSSQLSAGPVPGQASVFTATSMCASSSKWKDMGNPTHHYSSFESESTFILPRTVGSKNYFIFMGDRWKAEPEGKESGRYVWLPFSVKGEGKLTDRINITWRSSWRHEDI